MLKESYSDKILERAAFLHYDKRLSWRSVAIKIWGKDGKRINTGNLVSTMGRKGYSRKWTNSFQKYDDKVLKKAYNLHFVKRLPWNKVGEMIWGKKNECNVNVEGIRNTLRTKGYISGKQVVHYKYSLKELKLASFLHFVKRLSWKDVGKKLWGKDKSKEEYYIGLSDATRKRGLGGKFVSPSKLSLNMVIDILRMRDVEQMTYTQISNELDRQYGVILDSCSVKNFISNHGLSKKDISYNEIDILGMDKFVKMFGLQGLVVK
jgi:hypothetical protein